MKRPTLFLLLVLITGLSCTSAEDRDTSKVIAGLGTSPTIDGVLEEGEWVDAHQIYLDSTKTIFLKHDKKNLYIALNGDGGNLYFLKDDRI
jgi:hypothetical protein